MSPKNSFYDLVVLGGCGSDFTMASRTPLFTLLFLLSILSIRGSSLGENEATMLPEISVLLNEVISLDSASAFGLLDNSFYDLVVLRGYGSDSINGAQIQPQLKSIEWWSWKVPVEPRVLMIDVKSEAMIGMKSCSDGLPIRNPSASRPGSSAGATGYTNSTGSPATGNVPGHQGGDGDDNGNPRNNRGPAAMVFVRDWLALLAAVFGIMLNIFNLLAALSSVNGNSVQAIFTADNALVLLIVAALTLFTMALLHFLRMIN